MSLSSLVRYIDVTATVFYLMISAAVGVPFLPASDRFPLQFQKFVVFGRVHYGEAMPHKQLKLAMSLSDDLWIQDLVNRYYTFEVPTNRYSGLTGTIILYNDEGIDKPVWSKPFVVQDYTGAYRIDIYVSLALFGERNLQFQALSEQSEPCQTCYHIGNCYNDTILLDQLQCTLLSRLHKQHRVENPEQFPIYLLNWYITLFIIFFLVIIQSSNVVLDKAMNMIQGELSSEDYHIKLTEVDNKNLAARQLCLSTPVPGSYDELRLNEVWQVAEKCLDEAVGGDCCAAYFSYNCVTPNQGIPGWDRDGAGRLIRQLFQEK